MPDDPAPIQTLPPCRGADEARSWVIGRFVVYHDKLILECLVSRGRHYTTSTRHISEFSRWPSRQAAHQWLQRHARFLGWNPETRGNWSPLNLNSLNLSRPCC